MANGLELGIGADVSGLISGINAAAERVKFLEQRIAELQRAAANSGNDLGKLTAATKEIQKSQAEINRLMASGIPTFGKMAQAGNELEKRIRIATSAEHEFNSILGATPALLAGAENPAQALGHEFLILATGIQRAKEAGQTFTQISTTLLGSIFSLQGAITLGTALLFGFGKEIFGSGQKAKEAVDPIEQLGKSVAEEAAKLTATVGLIENVNTSQEDRVKALKAVNEEYGPLLKSMGLEEVSLGNIKQAYDLLIDSMIRRAVVKGLEDQIAASVKKTAAEIIRLKEAQENERIAEEKRAAAQKAGAQKSEDLATSAKKLGDNLRQNQRAVSENTGTFLPFVKQQADAAAKMHDFDGRVNDLTESLKKQLAPLLSLTDKFSDLGLKFDKTKTSKVEGEIIRLGEQLSNEFKDNLKIGSIIFETDDLKTKLTKAQALIDQFVNHNERGVLKEFTIIPEIKFPSSQPINEKKLQDELLPKGSDEFHLKLKAAIDVDTIKQNEVNKIQTELSKATSFGKILDLEVQLHDEDALKGINKQAAETAKIIDSTLTPAFQDLFTAIEQGGNPLKAFFKGLEQSVGQLISKLIAAAIEAAILNALIPGGVGGAKGFGAIFGKLLGFAEGGHVAAGGRASGHVSGPGTSRSDSIPAMLSNGEFVMKSAAVQKYGVSFMNAINQGQVDKSNSFNSITKTFNNRSSSFSSIVNNISHVKHFADGGLVTNISSTTSAADLVPASRVRNSVISAGNNNVNVSGKFRVDGKDLVLAISRQNLSDLRTT